METNHNLPAVLICEDDPDDLYFARLLVHRAGIHNPVVSVEDGEEAVTYLTGCMETKHLPCMVLLDIKMPILDGFDVLQWARNQSALSDVPFVMMSGSALEEDRERAKELGAKAYLVKYPTPEQLGEVIKNCCGAE